MSESKSYIFYHLLVKLSSKLAQNLIRYPYFLNPYFWLIRKIDFFLIYEFKFTVNSLKINAFSKLVKLIIII